MNGPVTVEGLKAIVARVNVTHLTERHEGFIPRWMERNFPEWLPIHVYVQIDRSNSQFEVEYWEKKS